MSFSTFPIARNSPWPAGIDVLIAAVASKRQEQDRTRVPEPQQDLNSIRVILNKWDFQADGGGRVDGVQVSSASNARGHVGRRSGANRAKKVACAY